VRGYQFRPVVDADLALVAHWRATPHVSEWWGTPSVEDEREKLGDPRIAMWIVELDGRPFAFAQDYDVHGWSPTLSRIYRLGHGASISTSARPTCSTEVMARPS
jgi:hypothetical protein